MEVRNLELPSRVTICKGIISENLLLVLIELQNSNFITIKYHSNSYKINVILIILRS